MKQHGFYKVSESLAQNILEVFLVTHKNLDSYQTPEPVKTRYQAALLPKVTLAIVSNVATRKSTACLCLSQETKSYEYSH